MRSTQSVWSTWAVEVGDARGEPGCVMWLRNEVDSGYFRFLDWRFAKTAAVSSVAMSGIIGDSTFERGDADSASSTVLDDKAEGAGERGSCFKGLSWQSRTVSQKVGMLLRSCSPDAKGTG